MLYYVGYYTLEYFLHPFLHIVHILWPRNRSGAFYQNLTFRKIYHYLHVDIYVYTKNSLIFPIKWNLKPCPWIFPCEKKNRLNENFEARSSRSTQIFYCKFSKPKKSILKLHHGISVEPVATTRTPAKHHTIFNIAIAVVLKTHTNTSYYQKGWFLVEISANKCVCVGASIETSGLNVWSCVCVCVYV